MFDYTQLFHVGVLVPDLERAMTELGDGLGLTWSSLVELEQPIWSPKHGSSTLPLRFTYSSHGPQRVELLQGPPGSIWDGASHPGVHHMGVWVDDVGAEVERLTALGWSLELARRAPEEGYGTFCYLRSPSGFLLEPVLVSLKPMFERWWAGAPLGVGGGGDRSVLH